MKRSETEFETFDRNIVSSYPLPVSIVSVEIESGQHEFASILATSVTPLGKLPATLTFTLQKTSGLVQLLQQTPHVFITQQPNLDLINEVYAGIPQTYKNLCANSKRVLKCTHKVIETDCSNNLYITQVDEYEENSQDFNSILYWKGSYRSVASNIFCDTPTMS
jgi:hypothetical protein